MKTQEEVLRVFGKLHPADEHSYRNVAVACARCNLKKHNRPIGQLLLIG